jgi:zinc resistance-associated protein
VRDLVQLRIQRVQARQAGEQQQPNTPFDRLARRADNMAKTSAVLKKVADAGAPLYQSLNDDQKNRFVMLARILRPHHGMRGDHEHGWRDGRRDVSKFS